MSEMLSRLVHSPLEMEQLGAQLAAVCQDGLRIHLQGELGAGKTTLVRGFLRCLGHRGPVKSPTYTLIEEYATGPHQVVHFDLYRLASPEELESVGIRDYLDGSRICLLEWPERAGDRLPAADVGVCLRVEGESRRVQLAAGSAAGQRCLAGLAGTGPQGE